MSDTPSLWSHFLLNLSANVWPGNAEKLARRYLLLSEPTQLELLFVREEDRPLGRRSKGWSLIRLICNASYRIRSLSARVSQDPFPESLVPPFRPVNLQKIHIHYMYNQTQSAVTFSWLSTVNGLTSLRLEGATMCEPIVALASQLKATQVSSAELSLNQSSVVVSPHAPHVELLVLDFIVHVVDPTSHPLPMLEHAHTTPACGGICPVHVQFRQYIHARGSHQPSM
jgi:hypothetical protein